MKDAGGLEVLPGEQGLEVTMLKELDQTQDVDSNLAVEKRLRIITHLAKDAFKIQEMVHAYIDEMMQWQKQKIDSLNKQINHLAGPLKFYLRSKFEATEGKIKSVSVPSGRIQLVQPKDSFQWTNANELLAWAKKNLPDAVHTKEEVLKPQIKKHVNATGDIPDGVDVKLGSEQKPTFHIILPDKEKYPIITAFPDREEEAR